MPRRPSQIAKPGNQYGSPIEAVFKGEKLGDVAGFLPEFSGGSDIALNATPFGLATKTGGKVINLAAKRTEAELSKFHKSFKNKLNESVSNLVGKVDNYTGWKSGVGQKFKSKKTGKIWEVTEKSWNIKKDVPMYLMKSADESGSHYADLVEESMIKVNPPTLAKPRK